MPNVPAPPADNMLLLEMTQKNVRRWFAHYIGGRPPAGVRWAWVAGLQHIPQGWDYTFLIADENGLAGIVGRKNN